MNIIMYVAVIMICYFNTVLFRQKIYTKPNVFYNKRSTDKRFMSMVLLLSSFRLLHPLVYNKPWLCVTIDCRSIVFWWYCRCVCRWYNCVLVNSWDDATVLMHFDNWRKHRLILIFITITRSSYKRAFSRAFSAINWRHSIALVINRDIIIILLFKTIYWINNHHVIIDCANFIILVSWGYFQRRRIFSFSPKSTADMWANKTYKHSTDNATNDKWAVLICSNNF